MRLPDSGFLDEHVKASLQEDLAGGDITSRQTLKKGLEGRATAVSRDPGVVAGSQLVTKVYSVLPEIDNVSKPRSLEFNWLVDDGEKIEKEQKLFEVKGELYHLLAGERIALNYLQQLSGVATETFRMVEVAREFGVDIYDTRKTIPHHRLLQKYAVSCGGGKNHRLTLGEAVMIKDNHKLAAGGLRKALGRLETERPLIVEIHEQKELNIISDFDIDVLMLDNMQPELVRDIVLGLPENQIVEISGGITMDNLKQYCKTGVDRISVGSLTHSFDSLDVSFGLVQNG